MPSELPIRLDSTSDRGVSMVFTKTWQQSVLMFDTDMQKDGCKRGVCNAIQCRKYATNKDLSIRSTVYTGKQSTEITLVIEDVF